MARRENFMARVEDYMQAKVAEVNYYENVNKEKENEMLKMQHETKALLEELQYKAEIQEADSKRWAVNLNKKIKAKTEFNSILKEAEETLQDRMEEYTTLSKRVNMSKAETATLNESYNSRCAELESFSDLKARLEEKLKSQATPGRGAMVVSVSSAADCGYQDSIIRAGNDFDHVASVISYQDRKSSLLIPKARAQSIINEPIRPNKGLLCSVGCK